MLADLRLALRLLRRNPGFSIVAILTLALGIGANTAIFSVVDGVLLRPAPVAGLDRLAVVWETDRNSGTTREPSSLPDFLDFRVQSRTFQSLAALMGSEVSLTPPSGDPVRLAALAATHDLLPMLGIAPLAGRTFTADEDRDGGPKVALISQSLWERSFGRDPAILGRTLPLNDEPYTVVGVVPDSADFGALQLLSAAAYSRAYADRGDRTQVDVFVPLQGNPKELPRSTHPIFVVGRLAPSVSIGAAHQEMAAITAGLERTYPENAGRGAFVEPMTDVVFGPVRPALIVLLVAVGLVLLIACVNIANLLLARGAARRTEVAVRAALGGGTGRLVRQFLIENIVLALAAAVLGVAMAVAGLRGLMLLAPADVPRLETVSIDARVLLVALTLSVLAGVAFGMVPILQARHLDLQSAIRGDSGGRTAGGRERSRLRGALVVAELALAVVLVVGAALLIKSFWRLQQVDAGFRADGVVKAEYQLPPSRYPASFQKWPDFPEMHAFTGTLLARATALPGVDAAAVAGNHPLDPGFTNSFTIVGREAEAEHWPEISVRSVSPGYFRTVGLGLRRGRSIGDADTTAGAPVAVLNEAAARRFFGDRDPMGAQIRFWGRTRTLVGVVADEKFQGLTRESPLAVYLPLAQAPSIAGAGVLLVRTNGDATSLLPAVRGVIREIDPALAVFGLETLEHTVARSVSGQRFTMVLLGLFALLALALAAVGIHGVLSYGVEQRRREIGVRMALGAHPSQVLRLVVGNGLMLAAIGLAIGLAGAFALARLLGSLLFGVSPHDPLTFAAVGLFLLAVAAAASYLPARRATSIDPAVALKAD